MEASVDKELVKSILKDPEVAELISESNYGVLFNDEETPVRDFDQLSQLAKALYLTVGNKMLYDVENIPIRLFADFTELKSIAIPVGVKELGSQCFRGCKNLESISLPKTVKWIGNSVFRGCESLKSIIIPEKVIVIGSRTFEGCRHLSTLKFESIPPASQVSYGFVAGIPSLTNVYIPKFDPNRHKEDDYKRFFYTLRNHVWEPDNQIKEY